MTKKLPLVALALTLIAVLLACGTVNDYRAASIEANMNARDYAVARVELDDLHTSGRLTPDHAARYLAIRSNVRLAGQTHDRAITMWRESGRKPADYDAVAATLKAEEQRMIALRNEVIR